MHACLMFAVCMCVCVAGQDVYVAVYSYDNVSGFLTRVIFFILIE